MAPNFPEQNPLKGTGRVPKIAVIGTASIDVIHSESDGARKTFHTIGGAGLYTALAAAAAGARVTLLAPLPDRLSERFTKVADMLNWKGPQAREVDMPRLEIIHHGNGKATLLNAAWGAESTLTPNEISGSLEEFDVVHIAALSSAEKQRKFFEKLRPLGAKAISGGTYFKLTRDEPDTVRELVRGCDYFFMNLNESQSLFPDGIMQELIGGTVFVTAGSEGCTIYDGTEIWKLPTIKVAEIDPTGAGDTFCGTALASICRGNDLTDAALGAMSQASLCVQSPGPRFLLEKSKN